MIVYSKTNLTVKVNGFELFRLVCMAGKSLRVAYIAGGRLLPLLIERFFRSDTLFHATLRSHCLIHKTEPLMPLLISTNLLFWAENFFLINK